MSAVRSWLFAVLVVAVLSCSSDEGTTVRISPHWSVDDAEAIRQSFAEWNEYTTTSRQFVERDDGEWLIEPRDPMIDYGAQARRKGYSWLAGHVDRDRHIVQILPLPLPGWTRAIALHEDGHLLGMRDSDHTSTGVMRAAAPQPAELVDYALMPVDVAACQKVGSCAMVVGRPIR